MWEYGGDRIIGNINLNNLNPDQAYINITSYSSLRLWIYSLSVDCIRCPFSKWQNVQPNQHALVRFNTARSQEWKVFEEDLGPYAFDNETAFYRIQPDVGQFGIYNLTCDDDTCQFFVTHEAVNIYLSILFFVLIAIGTTAAIYIMNYLYRRYKRSQRLPEPTTTDNEQEKSDNELEPKPTKPRLRSLDTFRGIAIVLMIFVNSGGGHYWWIEHATWNGLHIADLVFPWFLWIMGVCIPMSIKSQQNRGVPKKNMILGVAIRSLKLFLIGLFLTTNWGGRLEEVRIMGVLQRFGIAYFFITTIYILLARPFNVLPQERIKRALYDITILCPQWMVMIFITLLHLILTFALPVPGCPTGYLGPGGKHEMVAYPDCIGGATGYIDRLILTDVHLYQWGTPKSTYDSLSFDPEGVFGCLLTLVHVFLGLQCGVTLMIHSDWKARVKRWLLWAIVTGLIGGGLAAFSQDDGIIPLNKNMWSLSFVLVTTSFSFILLTICYLLIDVRGWWSGTPLVYAGMNAILMYCGHEIFHQMLPFRWRIGPMNTHFIRLLENAWNAMMWMFVAYYLHLKRIYFSI